MAGRRETKIQEILSKPHPRILAIVRDHMSGLLYTVPYLRALRQHIPQARIGLLANPYATSILNGCPYVDEVIPFFRFEPDSSDFGKLSGFAHLTGAWLHMVGRIDLVIHFRNVGPNTLLFCALLGRPFQVGYTQSYKQVSYNRLLDLDLGDENVLLDSRTRNARIIEALGIPEPSPRMEMWISNSDCDWAKSRLHSRRQGATERVIVMHPGCHWGCNEWLIDRWVRLGDLLQATTGARIVITGDERERMMAQRIANEMQKPAIVTAGETTLSQLAAIIAQADLVISVDTVPTQICQALRVPAVILTGAGNPKWNGPLSGEPMAFLQNWDRSEEGTLPCDFAAGTCHGPRCRSRLATITVDKVFEVAMKMLEEPETAYILGDGTSNKF